MLFKTLINGFGRLEDAIPKPNAGCIMKSGKITVAKPIIIAGIINGFDNHPFPKTIIRRKENEIPIR